MTEKNVDWDVKNQHKQKTTDWLTVTLLMHQIMSLMPLLHLPYDEYTMPVRRPNHRVHAASAGRPCDHSTDLRTSWSLRFCLTLHNDKFEKKL